jgi:hypothetical protein
VLIKTIHLYQPLLSTEAFALYGKVFDNLTVIGWYSLAFIVITTIFYVLRKFITQRRKNTFENTWGCGYVGNADKMQYTASSFVRTYRKLAEPIVSVKKEKKDAEGLFPDKIKQETHAADNVEYWMIDKPLYYIRRLLNRFVFLQNGNIQAYILYGFIFISLIILLPVIADKIETLVNFLNQL